MTPQNLEETLDAVIALTWQAADAAMAHYRPGILTHIKGSDPHNVVTQADHDANALLVSGLARLFPDDAILAEESVATHDPAARRHNPRLWCIDPIDGTRQFVAHSGDFAVMVGLAIDGAARLGVVLRPTTGMVFAGFLGDNNHRVAFCANRAGRRTPLRVNQETAPHKARLMVSGTHKSPHIQGLARAMGISTLVPLGSVGLKMAALAASEAELYVSLSNKTQEWDVCGPEAIVRAAGGTVTDLVGEDLRYNKEQTPTERGIVASNGVLHGHCLAALKEALGDRLQRKGRG